MYFKLTLWLSFITVYYSTSNTTTSQKTVTSVSRTKAVTEPKHKGQNDCYSIHATHQYWATSLNRWRKHTFVKDSNPCCRCTCSLEAWALSQCTLSWFAGLEGSTCDRRRSSTSEGRMQSPSPCRPLSPPPAQSRPSTPSQTCWLWRWPASVVLRRSCSGTVWLQG